MASIPPPQGMTDVDYDTIEAAVTETVRGRWFLNEFARRNRLAETRQLLDAMARLEASVLGGQSALPSADPSIRLLIQRIKEIAGQLGLVVGDMRAAGIDERYVNAVDSQARAVSGMLRGATPARPELPPGDTVPMRVAIEPTRPAPALPPLPRPPQSALPPEDPRQMPAQVAPSERLEKAAPLAPKTVSDARLAALLGLDGMSPSEKLSFFT